MGYGLDTTKYGTRKWQKNITWKGDAKGKLADGFLAWEKATGVKFTKTNGAGADFEVKWGDTFCCWSSKSSGVGKPDKGKTGTLELGKNATLGTVIHEVGHLLGLSHEQDHPTNRATYYDGLYGKNSFQEFAANTVARHYKTYGGYDEDSVMHYPENHYALMTDPSAGDIAAVKQINGW